MDLANGTDTKAPAVNLPPELRSQCWVLLIAILISNIAVTMMSLAALDMRSATNMICGALFLTINLTFYVVLSTAILIKKNIAWMGPVIVIKYLFLIVSVYFVWAYSNVLLVLSGMFVELLIIIIIYMILQKWLVRRDIENGSL